MSHLDRAITLLGHGGKSAIARASDVTPGAVHKWACAGCLPLSEITVVSGKRVTSYGVVIERLTDGAVTDEQLQDDVRAKAAGHAAA